MTQSEMLTLMKLVKDPTSLKILWTIIEDPRRGIDSLDLLIRSPNTPADARARYQDLRTSLENFQAATHAGTAREDGK